MLRWRQENGWKPTKGSTTTWPRCPGRGVFKGDVLSLYNWCPRWYGEGDEHIWVDGESFPSHFGCGTEDYYNTTYAPIHVYHFPFGGAPVRMTRLRAAITLSSVSAGWMQYRSIRV